jgi:transposase
MLQSWQPRGRYPDESRERAVRLVFESGRPIAHAARDLGVHNEALRLWVRRGEADSGRRRDLLTSEEVRHWSNWRQTDTKSAPSANIRSASRNFRTI